MIIIRDHHQGDQSGDQGDQVIQQVIMPPVEDRMAIG
jgi:hypothetical protein